MSEQVRQDVPEAQDRRVQADDRRFWAAVVDVWLLRWILGSAASVLVTSPAGPLAVGALLATLLVMATEARTGRTPGKAVTGLRTQQVDGGPVRWSAAVRRRWWMALPAIGLVPGVPAPVGQLVLTVVLAVLVVSMGRSSDGRGWHDRTAGTEVVPATPVVPYRRAIPVGVVAVLLALATGWWFGPTSGESSSFLAIDDATPVECEVAHDGWLYPLRQDAVTLTLDGEPFVERMGPHDIRLSFVEEQGRNAGQQRGLRVEVASRSLIGTSGRSTGTETRFRDVTQGPGLGTLTITCEVDH